MRDSDSELYKLITGLGKQAEEFKDEAEEQENTNDLDINESADPNDEERKCEMDDAQAGIPLANRRASVATMRRASLL